MAQQYVKAVELQLTITTTAREILPVNPQRQYALIVNNSDTEMRISLGGTPTTSKGIPLRASGGFYEITSVNLYRGRIAAICSASKTLDLVEF